MRRVKWWMGWVGVLAVCGIILAYLIYRGMIGYLGLQVVWVATKELPIDSPISSSDFRAEQWSKRNVPNDAIIGDDIKQLEGKLARTTILQDQMLVGRAVSTATSVREVNQNISSDYVTISIPLDSTDLPISEINNGDVITLTQTIRINTDEGEEIQSDYVAENVLVIKAIDDTKQGHQKLIVLVPRDVQPKIMTALNVGKVRIALDPRPFQLEGVATK